MAQDVYSNPRALAPGYPVQVPQYMWGIAGRYPAPYQYTVGHKQPAYTPPVYAAQSSNAPPTNYVGGPNGVRQPAMQPVASVSFRLRAPRASEADIGPDNNPVNPLGWLGD